MPIAADNEFLTLLTFIGGFSAATGMVIVAAVGVMKIHLIMILVSCMEILMDLHPGLLHLVKNGMSDAQGASLQILILKHIYMSRLTLTPTMRKLCL